MKKRVAEILGTVEGFRHHVLDVLIHSMGVPQHDGSVKVLDRIVMERKPSVAILAYDPKRDEVLLVNEFRPGMLVAGYDPFNDALPGGNIEPGQTLIDAVKKEMKEETGQKAKNIRVIHDGAFVSSGASTERLSLVFCTVNMSKAGGIHGAEGESEDIKTVRTKAKDFIKRAMNNELKNMGTCAAAFWFASKRKKLRKQLKKDNKKKSKCKKSKDNVKS